MPAPRTLALATVAALALAASPASAAGTATTCGLDATGCVTFAVGPVAEGWATISASTSSVHV